MFVEKMKTVRVGIVGLGQRTETLLVSLFAAEDIEVVAVCDLSDKAIAKIAGIFAKNKRKAPAVYHDYHDLLRRDDVDAVLIPTSWNSHLPIAADAMKAGKYAAIEVGGASSTEELWQLVHASEQTGTPLHDARELLLRPDRAHGPQYGPSGGVRRTDPLHRRL